MVQTIRRLTELPDHAHILDVGCGDALSLPMLESLSDNARAWGIEIDPSTILPDNPLRDRIYEKPLGDPVYRSMRFDLITALDVIEHIEDDRHAIEHMMRMLKPGGWLVITVPAMPSLWTRHDEINMHYRRYTRGGLTQRLEQHGELLDCRYLYTALSLPKLILAASERNSNTTPGIPRVPHRVINRLAEGYFRAEWEMAKRMRLPFGTSLIAVARKPVEAEIGISALN